MSSKHHVHKGIPRPSSMTADSVMQTERKLAGEDEAPAWIDQGVLHLIKTLRAAESANDEYSPIVEEQTKYLKQALKFLQEDPQARYEFGTSIEGATRLVSLLRARSVSASLDARLKKFVDPLVDKVAASQLRRGGLGMQRTYGLSQQSEDTQA